MNELLGANLGPMIPCVVNALPSATGITPPDRNAATRPVEHERKRRDVHQEKRQPGDDGNDPHIQVDRVDRVDRVDQVDRVVGLGWVSQVKWG